MMINILILFIFNLKADQVADCSSLTGFPVDEDTVETSQTLNNKTTHQACYQHEREYREFLIERSRQGLQHWQQIVNCHDNNSEECQGHRRIFDSYAESIEIYRNARNTFYERLARNWFEGLPENLREHARDCLISRESENPQIELGEHFRTIRVQNNLSPTLCVSIIQRYEQEITRLENTARNNPETIGFTSQQLAKLEDFENSNGAYLLSQQTLGNPSLTSEQIRNSIVEDFNFNITNINSFIESVENLPLSELDQLYAYQSFYRDQFIPTLGEDRDTYFPHCLESRTGECGRLLAGQEENLTDDSDLNRCYNNVLNHYLDLIPGRSALRSFNNYPQIASARVLNLLTTTEERSLVNQTDLQFVLGLPILDAAGLGIADSIASSTIRTADGILIRIADEFIPTGAIADDVVESGRHTGSMINRVKSELAGDRPQELPETEEEAE